MDRSVLYKMKKSVKAIYASGLGESYSMSVLTVFSYPFLTTLTLVIQVKPVYRHSSMRQCFSVKIINQLGFYYTSFPMSLNVFVFFS